MPGPRRTDLHAVLARVLHDRRLAAQLTQEELAAQIGRQQSYISKLERAERRLDAVELLEVVDAIGCGIAAIFDELRAARDAERQARVEGLKRRGSGQNPQRGSVATTGATTPRRKAKPRAD